MWAPNGIRSEVLWMPASGGPLVLCLCLEQRPPLLSAPWQRLTPGITHLQTAKCSEWGQDKSSRDLSLGQKEYGQGHLTFLVLNSRIVEWLDISEQTCIGRQVLYHKHHLGCPNTPGSALKKKAHLQLAQVIYTGTVTPWSKKHFFSEAG